MRRAKKTPLAHQDYRDILKYLAKHSAPAAKRFATELAEGIRLLTRQPLIGRDRGDLSPGLRSMVVGKYLVFFRFTDEEVQVIRIVHGSRDLNSIFDE